MNIFQYINEKKICAVVRVNDKTECLNIVNALYDGGIRIVEIIMNPGMQLEVIEKLKDKEDLYIIAGGIITAREAITLINNGVKSISSPVLQTSFIRLCSSRGIHLLSTVSTANEAYSAWKHRLPMMKLHPADALGGAIYIKEILKTMPFLNIVAAGGIKISEIQKYIDAGALGVFIGRDFYQSMDYEKIKNAAQSAIIQVRSKYN